MSCYEGARESNWASCSTDLRQSWNWIQNWCCCCCCILLNNRCAHTHLVAHSIYHLKTWQHSVRFVTASFAELAACVCHASVCLCLTIAWSFFSLAVLLVYYCSTVISHANWFSLSLLLTFFSFIVIVVRWCPAAVFIIVANSAYCRYSICYKNMLPLRLFVLSYFKKF